MLKKKFFALGVAVFLTALAGCDTTVPYNSNSGHNGDRVSATQLLIDMNQTETINAPEGDNEDWFFFKPSQEGFVKISVFFDTPSALVGTISLYDDFGRPFQSMSIDSSKNVQEIEKFEVKPERYFVAVKVDAGASNFTINASFELPPPPDIIDETPVDDTNVSTTTKKDKCVPIDKCKKGQRCCKAPTVTTSEGIPEGATIVKGTIILVTPREGEISDIKISGLGSSKGVKKGMKAYLRGLNRKVDIYSCATTFCNATIKATSEELARYDSVDVVISE